jgi:hypothetical protein
VLGVAYRRTASTPAASMGTTSESAWSTPSSGRQRRLVKRPDAAVGETQFDLGDGLFAVSHIAGHGKFSGIALDMPLFQVVSLRNGMIVRPRHFAKRDQALEAAGLAA